MSKETLLPVMEHFYTLQGEGYHSGKAAYFIRLGGCDVGCVWCDVKESWEADVHPKFSLDEIVSLPKEREGKLVVITGGEPLMYNLDELCSKFKDAGYQLNIETSGAHPLSGKWDWLCFSPKKFKQPLEDFYEAANELKVIIFNKSDFEFAESHAAKVNPNCKLFLQVEWDKREQMMPLVIDYVKKNPKWRVSIQTHKYMNIP